MKILKRLAFSLVKDDIEQVLKIHDQKIMDHYMKIVDDVEEILEDTLNKRNAEFTSIIQEQVEATKAQLKVDFEEAKNDLYRNVQKDIQINTPTAKSVAAEIDTGKIVDLLHLPVAAAVVDVLTDRLTGGVK
jgi:hypothetical protein